MARDIEAIAAHRQAVGFVVLIGVVSLFADMTYEGARAITGPFLAVLGASGAVVGIVAGFGELVGYGLRLASGYLADRTGRYWGVILIGYAVNMLAVPLLALAGRWDVAAALMIAERVGKAIRTPPRDALLSHAASRMGRGWAFGLHEAMDQIGAVLGPVLVAVVLALRAGYHTAFAILLIPAVLALGCLVAARLRYPEPQALEAQGERAPDERFPRVFWIYLVAVAFLAAGYADFPLIAFHLKKVAVASDTSIPLLYALAMGTDAVAALVLGRFFDAAGFRVLTLVPLLSCLFAPFVFSTSPALVVIGTVLWGVGMGAQESIVRAAIAGMIVRERRGTAFGVFNSIYGVVWFAGSAFMGALYDVSLPALIAFSVICQIVAVPIFYRMRSAPRVTTGQRPDAPRAHRAVDRRR
ncbi:MAG: MFS transporter [Candidatus Rokubacteria bacterium]|nr:MFS transporter [Candidatus Rokubacteria bacterium]MBI3824560.1 MFS transporter [Candidatus Rokubacteria bacterium]